MSKERVHELVWAQLSAQVCGWTMGQVWDQVGAKITAQNAQTWLQVWGQACEALRR